MATTNKHIGVLAGSFNPFTIGHADIVERGLKIFDHIIICVGINISKPDGDISANARAQEIQSLYAGREDVSVECWSGLTAQFVIDRGADALLRGVRSVKDYEYERDMADANRQLFGVETVLLYSDPSKSWVSSSLVRELQAYGHDVTPMLPNKQSDIRQ